MTNQKKGRWLHPPVIPMTYKRLCTSVSTWPLLTCNYEKPVVLFSILILMHVASLSTRAQWKITAIEKNLRPVETTRRITCIRHRTLRPEPEVLVPMDLENGDELISNRGVMTVKVKCGTSAVYVLSGRFRARFLRSDEKGCSIFYSSSGGELNVRASAPTNVQSGEIRLGSSRTLYGIKTIRTKRGLARQWIVYEGEVGVESPAFLETVKEGEKLITKGAAALSTQNITQQDIRQAANAYARVEVSQTNISNSKDLSRTFLKLQSLHQAVLADPKNEQKRVDLVNEQARLNIPMAVLDRPPTRESLLDLIQQGNHREAIAGFDKRVSENRSDSRDYYGLALAHEKLSNGESATAFARKALDLNRTDGRLSENEQRDSVRIANPKPTLVDEQAALFELIRQGKYKDAMSGFEQRIREGRSNSRDYWGVALARGKLESPLEAIAGARQALDLNAEDHRLHGEERVEAEKMAASEQNYLFNLIQQRRNQDAIAGFQRRVRDKRSDSRDYYGLALGFQGLGDTLQSVDSALAALARNESDHRLSREEHSDCARIASAEQDYVFRLIAQRRYDQASERLQRRIREKRSDSRDYYALALASEGLGTIDQAIAYAQQALKVNSTDGRLAGKEYDDCVRMANTGKKIDKQPPEPKDEQAELFRLIDQGRYKDAIVGFDRRVRAKRENSRDYYGLALAYRFVKEAKASAANAHQALQVNKDDKLLSQKEQQECSAMEAILGGVPDTGLPSEQDKLFDLIRRGEYKEALAGFQRRIQEKRYDSRDYYGLALSYQGLKDEEQATVYAQQALKLNDSDRRLSKEEQNDCRGIASRKKG